MTVIVKHNKTNSITDWTQAQLDEQIALGNFAPGTLLADIVLPSDWNNDHTLTGLGTMAEQDATAVAITGGTATLSSVTTPSVTAPTNNLTLSAISTGAVRFNTLGGLQAQVTDQTSADLVWTMKGGSSSLAARATLGTNSGAPNFYATGGTIIFTTNGANNADALRITHTASAVNYVNVAGGATTKEPIISVAGSDSDISMALQSKGTGAIDLAAGSSGVNISNGGTVTAITRTTGGSLYTASPTITISPPTTASGVTATATCTLGLISSSTIGSGGTGYTVGNVLTLVGGTSTVVAQITVATVSSGVITGFTVSAAGTYTAAPSNPASLSGGTGSGATLNTNFTVNSTFTITNAGSGYIEQPTITFSGGGGSGAAAYATVGSAPIVKTLGNALSFNVPSGEVLRLTDGSSAACYLNLQSSSTTIQAFASSSGSNVGYQWVTKGVSNHSFATNNSVSTEQFRISHTASAVNYVQVTGAATGNPPTISPQGSDGTIAMLYVAKGGQDHRFFSNSGSAEQFRVIHTAGTIANQTTATGSATGVAPIFGVRGTDTDIDLALTPKGTGKVRFGTYTASMALTVQGYIEIKDSGGTIRKLAVIA